MYWRTVRHLARRPATSRLRCWTFERGYSTQNQRLETPTKTSVPLRILFCGSDEFSSASLKALHEAQRRDPNLIASIDVLCRPGKPYGRSLKTVREVPIKAVAEGLGLPIHVRDTFTGWDLPETQGEAINLIVAVSFGLFVPPRILKAAAYGGLNVHPSILPNFRGPAPLQYTIMTNADQCGVTLQTLDEASFDNGIILAQTKNLPIPLGKKCTYPDLLNFITPIAASLLIQGLRDRVFVPPHIDVGLLKRTTKMEKTEKASPTKIVHAPKITSADKRLNCEDENAIPIERRHRALGRLWSEIMFDHKTKKRVIFEDMEVVDTPEIITSLLKIAKRTRSGLIKVGLERRKEVQFMVICPKKEPDDYKPRFFVVDGDAIIVAALNGALRVKKITVEGKGKQDASKVFEGQKEWKLWNVMMNNCRLTVNEKLEGVAVDEALEDIDTSDEEVVKDMDAAIEETGKSEKTGGREGDLARRKL